jgi:hypothetical protein
MDKEPTFFLDCVRKNGRRERTGLIRQTLSEAREHAEQVLRLGNGLYTEVDICNECEVIENIQNFAVPVNLSEIQLVEDRTIVDPLPARH